MCSGTFTSPTFIRDLGMALYFVGGVWRKHKGNAYSKKGD